MPTTTCVQYQLNVWMVTTCFRKTEDEEVNLSLICSSVIPMIYNASDRQQSGCTVYSRHTMVSMGSNTDELMKIDIIIQLLDTAAHYSMQ